MLHHANLVDCPTMTSAHEHIYILTGASRGMGLAMARQLLAPGNTVLTLARRVSGELAPLAASAGAALTQWSTDLTDGTAAATHLRGWLGDAGSYSIRSMRAANKMPRILQSTARERHPTGCRSSLP